ncbi:glycosyltransferase [Stenotrophomonas maltophilia]|uniref:glycosyltransferase n=1 Tax=Stenotrophomonas maltophilia TaxID=40324 RepID=UPI000E21FAC9|nr:glycosyltransferase [Stenotrophomonas maltophilia]REC82822.1 glycosyltransferase [Stenotrophomonas maltophilia]
MGLKVFVTRELFPFTAGGIGRVIANMLMTAPEEDRAEMAILYVGDNVEADAFAVAHPGVTFLAWPHSRFQQVDERGEIFPPMPAFTHSMLHWESVHVLQGLLELERLKGPLEYVEFVDWGAPAFAATQEKLLGSALTTATLAVRLHTTDSILTDFEPRVQSVHGLNLFDLERKALADCDLIVGQIAPVAEAFRVFYGFSEEEWTPRLRLHAPPVLLDTMQPVTQTTMIDDTTPLLFTSKLQDIKRPDTFIRGCIQFLRDRPRYQGNIVFLAHSFDVSYQEYVISLVPEDLRSRVVFARGVTGAAREKSISGAVCVFPSPWESFCLAAYEASLSGAACVLNAENPAFGPGSPWRDGYNCSTFDGSAEDLARALCGLFESAVGRLSPVEVPKDPLPWKGLDPVAVPAAVPLDRQLTVVVVNRDSAGRVLNSLDSILASNLTLDKLIVIDDASRDPRDIAALDQLGSNDPRLSVHRLAVPVGDAVARNMGLALVETPFAGFVRGGDQLLPGFLNGAVSALASHRDFDVVVGQVGVTVDPDDVIAGNVAPDGFRIFYGEGRLAGLYENRLAPESYVIRTEAARRFAFDPVIPALEVWEMMLRACQSGARFMVTSAVNVLARHQGQPDERHLEQIQIAMRRRLQRKRVRVGSLEVPAYFIFGAHVSPSGFMGDASNAEMAYRLQALMESESVRYTLALARLLQKRAPWVLRLGKWSVQRLAPIYRRLR